MSLLFFKVDKESTERWYKFLKDIDQKIEPSKIKVAGREFTTPRGVLFMGERGSEYRYSGIVSRGEGLPTEIREMCELVGKHSNCVPNSVIISRYGPGDKIGMHKDNKESLAEGSEVSSISFGASRYFRIMSSSDRELPPVPEDVKVNRARKSMDVLLEHGQGVVMGHDGSVDFQDAYKHGIPAVNSRVKFFPYKGSDVRYSVTFRAVCSSDF